MLVNPHRLKKAVNHLPTRNELIQSLVDQSPHSDVCLASHILAIFLGNNIGYESIPDNIPRYHELDLHIKLGAIYFLRLDQIISMAKLTLNVVPASFYQLRQAWFAKFNEDYLLFFNNPIGFLDDYLLLFCQLKWPSTPTGTEKRITHIKQEITELLRSQRMYSSNFWYYRHYYLNDQFNFRHPQQYITTKFNQLITYSCKLYPFLNVSTHLTLPPHLRVRKIFIETTDHLTIDGLYIQNKTFAKSTVILVLAGHFQAEDNYLSTKLLDFYNLFNEDIIFVNHRNFSLRSAKLAENMQQLADDIACFAKYSHKHYGNIVLYGMCGGSAQMILASERLHSLNIQHRLILDRFASHYLHFPSIKQASRIRSFSLKNDISNKHFFARFNYSPAGFYLITIPTIFFIQLFLMLVLKLTNNDYHFSDKVSHLPTENTLLLQGKSEEKNFIRQNIDIIIHPENDLRLAQKKSRQNQKQLFKQFRLLIQGLISHSLIVQELKGFHESFGVLSEFFIKAVEQLNNEKLKSSELTQDASQIDIHSHRLFQLTTRHEQPLPLFLRGFFKPASSKVACWLDKLIQHPASLYETTLEATVSTKNTDQIKRFSLLFNELITLFIEHKMLITHTANRLIASRAYNPTDALKTLALCVLNQPQKAQSANRI